ncbi:hypothetical protein CMU89_04830 [Elizabethkingia anophelis]|nr:hypothetical protein [Elizabethkingia anophelis]MDV3541984.1 hypothetical protein [Elizabethkingia anophelis]
MNNIDVKKVAIYAGLALLAYKLFNTKISVSTGLTDKKAGIDLNVTGGGTGSTLVPQPDPVVDTGGPVTTAPVSTLEWFGSSSIYNPRVEL